MPTRSHEECPVREKVKVLNLIKKKKTMHPEVAERADKNEFTSETMKGKEACTSFTMKCHAMNITSTVGK